MFSWTRSAPSRLERLRGEHAEDCAALHAESFAHPWSAQEFAALIGGSSAVGAAALDPVTREIRGFALSRRAGDEAEILTIAVASAWRGRGVGREILGEHLQQAAFAGARAMFLEVDPDNVPAVALYKRFSFVKVGERKGYFRRASGAPAAAWIMRRDLA